MKPLIILWILTSPPGTWTKQDLVFDTVEDCHKITYLLMERVDKTHYLDLPEFYKNPTPGSGIMFQDKCDE